MESWRRSFYALWMAQWLAIIGFSFVLPFTPLFVQELGITELQQIEWWSGVLAASTSVTLTVVSPIWGVMADRHGRKMMVQRAMFGGAVIVAAMAFSRNVYDLLALRALQGIVTGTVTASVALAAAVSPRELLGRNLGLMQTAVFAGSSLGPLIGGVLADRLGYRPVFVVTGALLFVGGLIVTLLVDEKFTPVAGRDSLAAAGFLRDLWVVLAIPALLVMNLLLFSIQAASLTISPILALFIQILAGENADVASLSGLVFGATALSSALAAATIGRHSDRWGYRRVLLWCIVGAGLFTIPQAFVGNTIQLILLRLVQGAFMGGIVPTANAIIGTVVPPERRGSAFGVTASASSLGNVVGPLVGAGIAASLDLRAVFVFTGLSLLAVGAALARHRLKAAPYRR